MKVKRNSEGMTEGEEYFALRLKAANINFIYRKKIDLGRDESGKRIFISPDFYLQDYNVYCEVAAGSRNTITSRWKRIRLAIAQGNKFTFYSPHGTKLFFTDDALHKMGRYTNSDFPVIQKITARVACHAGRSTICSIGE